MPASQTGTARLDVSEVIDNSAIGPVHISTFTLCALCMVMDGFDVQALGYVAPAIIQEWKISPALLGPVFGASNFGVLVGQLSFTMVADKVGRRPVLIAGAVAFGLLTLLTGRVTNVEELFAVRFLAGAALGSIIPNATALIGEFSPKRSRVTLMTWVGIGFTAGAALGGFVAAWMIPRFGWPSVFYFGGTIPILLAALMMLWLPESLKLLALKGRRRDYIATWLKKVSPSTPITNETAFVVPEASKQGVPLVHLFRDGRAIATLLLWVVNFMNLLNLYSLANWLPTVVRGAGYSTSTAVLVGTMLQVGGTISPFLFAWLIMRKGFIPVLAATFALGTVMIALIGQPGISLALLVTIVFIAGACVVGAQPSVNALSATYYPTYLRATGLGWGLGIGRAGSIVGPVVTGWFIALQWTTQSIFLALAIPALTSMIFVLLLSPAMGDAIKGEQVTGGGH